MSSAGGGVSDWVEDEADRDERMTSILEDTRSALMALWGMELKGSVLREATEMRTLLLTLGCDRHGTNMTVVELFSPPGSRNPEGVWTLTGGTA